MAAHRDRETALVARESRSSAGRATARMPREGDAAAFSKTSIAAGVPMRASAEAAAARSCAVLRGAHHSPR